MKFRVRAKQILTPPRKAAEKASSPWSASWLRGCRRLASWRECLADQFVIKAADSVARVRHRLRKRETPPGGCCLTAYRVPVKNSLARTLPSPVPNENLRETCR